MSGHFELADLFQDPEQIMRAQRERMARAEELQRRVREAVGSASSDDDRIAVSYSEANGVQGLSIDPRAMRMGSQDLAEEITRLVNQARDDVQRQISGLVDEAFADGAPDPREIAEQLPAFEQTMDEILRDTEHMGQEITDIMERMRRMTES
ncbi:YbaB/EbfC family nucleoid-associated protein [Actinopolymorpha sp. NPDC004070]|uniref:YbaB/EbfC family nucleoid-associated protein n=1 Tax=Actinopolymorpha sp. NPDC004070 TaxID=3154548 RepID=UPI0033A29027